MRPREARRRVLLDARLRHDSGWSDARILDISTFGLMAITADAPRRGAYVEINRGAHRIVARVVWAKDGRFGARVQDAIAVESMTSGVGAVLVSPVDPDRERRLRPRGERPEERRQRSRRWSRRIEFLAVGALGFAAAGLAFESVRQTLSKPFATMERKLEATP